MLADAGFGLSWLFMSMADWGLGKDLPVLLMKSTLYDACGRRNGSRG
jgi:hypothetical protein